MEHETATELDTLSQVISSTQVEYKEPGDNKNELPQKTKYICISTGIYYDFGNILLLLFLYLLQGIPIGFCVSVPMLLQSRNVSYKDQAIFSMVFWPFSLKLLWAPLVDSLYIKSIGRRKSWLIPTQYGIGFFMIHLSAKADDLIGKDHGTRSLPVDIWTLTVLFFMLYFLAATQDVVVDGWALTMLSRRNVGWASICNMVGQTAGFFIGNVLFLALESADFCNKYIRTTSQDVGIVTLSSFLHFWGIVFLITTTLVWILKAEKKDGEQGHEQGILATYKLLLQIIRLPAVIKYSLMMLTGCIGFAAADFITNLKLIENGVKKEMIALFAVPMVPIQIIIPLYLSKFTTSSRPMDIAVQVIPYRLLVSIVYAFIVWLSVHVQQSPGVYPSYFYGILLASFTLHQIGIYCMRASFMAFHAKVSDPAIGGTYMTLLNTVGNLALKWPGTVSLWMIESLTSKKCDSGVSGCYTKIDLQACKQEGGSCITVVDGYYVEVVFCLIIGFLWYYFSRHRLRQLDSLGQSAWKCEK